MADTAALVVALSAQLSKFEKDLQKAGVIAEKSVKDIESKFENLNPQIKASFLGNLFSNAVTASIEAAAKAVTDFYSRFKELDKQARLTGESMKDLWSFQELAKKSGATTEDALRSLRSMAELVNQMKRGQDNSLSQLFDANPQALKGVNRETLTFAQTLEIVANLVRDAKTELDKVDIARLAGLTQDWVKELEKGGPAVVKTVAGLRAAAPPLDDMVTKAKEFDEFMKSAAEWAKSAAVKAVEGIGSLIQRIGGLTYQGAWKVDNFAGRWGEMQAPGTAPGTGAKVPTGARTTNVPVTSTGDKEASSWERTNDQINKNIKLMLADTAATGENTGEHERRRTIALLEAAADKDRTTITAKMTEQMNLQAEAAARAAQAQAVAQYRMKELNDASKEFGSALADGFKGLVLEGKKLDEVLKNLMNRLAGKAIDKLFDLAFAVPAGGGTSMFTSLLGLGAKAGGGSVYAGTPYLVGEHGPELMVPGQSGMIVPNQALGRTGRALTVAPVYNIDASGADTAAVARLQAALIATNRSLESRALAAVSSHMARGA